MLVDAFSRPIEYLRISVTDHCDLRCMYCRPRSLPTPPPLQGVLSTEDILAIVSVAARLGVRKVRLTGGEALLRRDIVELVQGIAQTPGIRDIGLTTNALHLYRMARPLREAGLKRVTISLDTLRPERFAQIAGAGSLNKVLKGMEAARAAGLVPLKINMVVMRGVNDDEVEDFAALTVSDGWHVRFIEFMPIGGVNGDGIFISTAEIEQRLPGLEPVAAEPLQGPARVFRFAGASGTVGFISAVSQHFCDNCNRLRLTADGRLRPCLLRDGEVDLQPVLRDGRSPERIEALIRQAVANKPRQHGLAEGANPGLRTMTQIGG